MHKHSAIAVIGSGIAGLTCAYRFVEAGFNVTVYSNACSQATRVATGMSSVKGNRLTEQSLFKLKVAGHFQLLNFLQTIEKESGEPIVHFGVHEPFFTLMEYQTIAEKVFRRQFRGLFKVERVSFPDRAHAFFYPQDFYFDPCTLLNTLRRLLSSKGVRFEKQQINNISTSNQEGYLSFNREDTPLYDEVVLAAGEGSYDVLQSSGFSVHSLSKIWGETVVSEVSSRSGHCGLTRLGRSFVKIGKFCRGGATSLPVSDSAGAKSAQQRLDLLAEHAKLFDLKEGTERFESGVRLRSASRRPLIGEFWFDSGGRYRLRVATAYYKNGLQFADIAACFHVSHVLNRQYASPILQAASQPIQILT